MIINPFPPRPTKTGQAFSFDVCDRTHTLVFVYERHL